MNKRSQITHITPLPSYVSRDAVLELLHDHSTIITLNPLVTHHGRTPPPEHALPDEHSSAWYEITDKIEYIPGTSLTGSVTYTACMHDLPNGLQTHVHAPAGLEIRGKWQLLGWLPGEEREHPLVHLRSGRRVPGRERAVDEQVLVAGVGDDLHVLAGGGEGARRCGDRLVLAIEEDADEIGRGRHTGGELGHRSEVDRGDRLELHQFVRRCYDVEREGRGTVSFLIRTE